MSAVLRLAREAAWAPLGVLLLFAVGQSAGATEEFWWLLHALGGGAAAYFVRRASPLFESLLGRPSALTQRLLAFGMACAAALAWECGEFLLDQLRGTQLQVSLENTMIDLILGMLGALAVVLLERKREIGL